LGQGLATIRSLTLVVASEEHSQREVSGGFLRVSRRRAFLTHLAVSTAIVGFVCALIFFVWYPHPYFQAMGAWGVLRVLIGVDLVLGPLLTLIVFKPGKRGLKFDLWAIACIQLTALLYGAGTIYHERPYFTVFAVDRFYVLPRADVDAAQLAAPDLTERIGVKPALRPLLVAAVRPSDTAGLQQLLEDLFAGKPDIERRPEFWRRYSDQTAQVIARAKPAAEFAARHPAAESKIAALAVSSGLPRDRLGVLPLIAKNRDMSLVIDMNDGDLLDVVDVDPWADSTSKVTTH
jgi:hypothetical protein